MLEALQEHDPAAFAKMSVFAPWDMAEYFRVAANGVRFVHYTSAEVLVSMVRCKEIWMRNAAAMNDFSEVEYGAECLSRAISEEEHAPKLTRLMNDLHAGVWEEAIGVLHNWLPDMRTNTFITCLSEHRADEYDHGRLSMWRAYGAPNGVALILNQTPFLTPSDELKAFTSPVRYVEPPYFSEMFAEVAENFRNSGVLFEGVTRRELVDWLFHIFRTAVLCTKHPGFSEEKEWRVIYSPSLGESPAIKSSVEVVRGVPQIVNKIPLLSDPTLGLNGAAIPDLLHRVLIGPTADTLSIYNALVQLLRAAGVAQPQDVVRVSGIPLRTW